MSARPAAEYAAISARMNEALKAFDLADRDQVYYMMARAALLAVKGRSGARRAAEMAYGLGDELVGEGG